MPPLPLVVIGSGPKGLAIHAKSWVLREHGLHPPEVVLIDHQGTGANWTGESGFTDGKQVLGTPPEKDLGFPYRCEIGEPAFRAKVDASMGRFSWRAFKIQTGRFAGWIDRGRPHPRHSEWAEYLQWAQEQSGASVTPGMVTDIEPSTDGWKISYASKEGSKPPLQARGIVITGPGEPISLKEQDPDPSISDGKTFWQEACLDGFRSLRKGRVAVIGTGETAASIVATLADMLPSIVKIDLISSVGVVYSRGESYDENRYFTDPAGWESLNEESRSHFIRRTDRGVFSLSTKARINRAENVETRQGKALSARTAGKLVRVEVLRSGRVESWDYDRVVVAIGFNPLSCGLLFRYPGKRKLFPLSGTSFHRVEIASRAIRHDLTYQPADPLRLHLPMLAGLQQGPGFPNLSSLGRLSDRILEPYL